MASRDALWAQGHDESVEVNQRALIDKVLARYSGEFTVFRELLQNSDDAQATAVEIHFNRDPTSPPLPDPLPDLKSIPIHRWSFKNNGVEFRDEDWNRLKKIAEGNPDEDKIGAFGVGFYSLFSVTEEPFVTSGDKWMGFYWKDQKDQLTARRGGFSAEERQPWTTFDMKLRDPSPMPPAFDFARFLSSSITFMSHLSEISVFFGEDRLMRISKSRDLPESLRLPPGLTRISPKGLMQIVGMNRTPLHIKAEVMRWVHGSEKPPPPPVVKETKPLSAGGFFSSVLRSLNVTSTPQRAPEPLPVEPVPVVDPRTISETNVSLAVYSADVAVKLDSKLDSELLRSTKKRAPSKLSYHLIYTAKDEYDASMAEDSKQTYATGSIFQGLRADLNGTGTAKIFIGHATGQTTGIGGHMATRFIPTVERESIDLMDRNVALWNQALLFVGGWLSRATYDSELADIGAQWTKAAGPEGPPLETRTKLIERAIHTLRFFTFHRSTPSQQVSQLLLESFFSCGRDADFQLITTMGVRKASQIRRPDPKFAGFLKALPVLPDDVVKSAPIMVSALESRGMVKNIFFDDVLNELRSRPLPEDQMVACLKWWINTFGESSPSRELLAVRKELLDAAILTCPPAGSGTITVIPLSTIRTFLNTKSSNMNIPLDGPLPEDMLPVSVAKELPPLALAHTLPWEELTILQWVRHICRPDVCAKNVAFDISLSVQWAERVLLTLSKHWTSSLSNAHKTEIVVALVGKSCVPTSHGLRKPQEAYFQSAALFPDLPVITFPSGAAVKGSLEKLLMDMGARKHVELQMVFTRMVKTNEWSTYDLVKYLASVRSTLEPDEWSKLRITPTFYKEGAQQGDSTGKPIKNKASDLYEPTETFRALRLPVLEWHGQKWRGNSEEAKFLFELGLRRQPPLGDLLQLCASKDETIRQPAFKYLVDNLAVKYKHFNPAEHPDIAYVPAVNAGQVSLYRHNQVYSKPEWSHFGLTVTTAAVTPEIATKLKIQADPSTPLLVSLLEKRAPKDEAEAGLWFGILARRIADFTKPELARLSDFPIVPVRVEEKLKWFPPSRCYFKQTDASTSVQSKLFVFVDFSATANSFLSACGTKRNPTIEEIAQMLLNNPENFRHLAGNDEEYLVELRNLAINARALSQTTLKLMQRGKVLLGIKRIPKSTKIESVDAAEEEEMELITSLMKAEDIVIADDNVALQYFGEKLFTAPPDVILEDFYLRLGSKRLSTLVKDEYRSGPERPNSKAGSDLRALILERLPLLLHEHEHAKLQIQTQWLNSSGNFIVRVFNKLEVTKLLRFNAIADSRRQDAYSVAIRKSKTAPLELWIADNQPRDYFEIANCLNRYLFESPKANDAMLFMTILMTDLRSLQRRGYNINRILNQQRTAQELRAKTSIASLPPPSPAPSSSSQTTLVPPPPPPTKEPSIHLPPTTSTPVPQHNPTPVTNNLVQNLRRFVTGPSNRSVESVPTTGGGSGLRPSQGQGGKQGATPLSNINSNISQAVNACRPENGNLLRNREQMSQVTESLQDGYCDISGQAGDLTLVGQVGRTKVYLSPGVPDHQTFLSYKQDSLNRFVHIIGQLSSVYELPITSLHIFYDVEGGLIAFNRNASIFLNLRYYEAWHDEAVSRDDTNTAFISWYFTLAHEIAHNLVQPHNSEHEFYFSAISEKYLLNLNRVLK